jgi:hypothetical protein
MKREKNWEGEFVVVCRGFCKKWGAEHGVLVVSLWWFVW